MSVVASRRQAQALTAETAWLLVTHCRWYELALRRHNFTSERLTSLAQKVASDALRLRGSTLQDRFDDLVSRLVIVGLQAAIRYGPERQHLRYGRNGGEPFASYVADIMDKRDDDYLRSKAEGFGNRSTKSFAVVTPVAEVEVDAPEGVDFDLIHDGERARWQRAAEREGQDLQDWIVNALNRRARETLAA